jgi:hypothetical protein
MKKEKPVKHMIGSQRGIPAYKLSNKEETHSYNVSVYHQFLVLHAASSIV